MSPNAHPQVCCVVLNWNGWRDTLACLESLQLLDYSSHALIVDNGSTDESVARIRAAYPDVTVLETGRNLGFAGGCNVGIRQALRVGADYVWLLNNDTVVEPSSLAALVNAAEADQRIGMVASVLRYYHRPDVVQAWGGGAIRWWLGLPHHLRSRSEAHRLEYLIGASVLIRSDMLREIGLFDGKFFMYWEDADLSIRARRSGWRLAVSEDSIVLHKEGGTSNAGSRERSLAAETYHLQSLVLFMKKHHRLWPLPILTRAILETGYQLFSGRPNRILPLFRAMVSSVRTSSVKRIRDH